MAILAHSSFLQETRTCIKAWMSSSKNQILPLTTELPALEHLKNQCIMFLSLQFLYIFLSMNGAYAFQKLTRSISKGNNLLIYKLPDCICSVLFLALTL